MGWANYRMDQYHQGKYATWLERRILEHANPLHFILTVIAGLGIAYGLWAHESWLIIFFACLCFLGHAYSCLWKTGQSA